jgi:hypothetical protein
MPISNHKVIALLIALLTNYRRVPSEESRPSSSGQSGSGGTSSVGASGKKK